MEKEGVLYTSLQGKRAVCNLCYRRCNIGEGQIGFCGVRKNIGGKIYLIAYGKLTAVNIDPIEKKPLFHYRPGSSMLSLGTVGCNYNCLYCQNWDISHERGISGHDVPPEELVNTAVGNGADGITYTYNEPTIFAEYAIDTAILARKHGIFNTFVTNGYMTPEAANLLSKHIDAMTVDFKGNARTEFARKYISILSEEAIFQTLLELKKRHVFIEITDLVVPRVGDAPEDAEKLVKWIYDNLGPDVPLHFLRFHPDYKMMDFPETLLKTLEKHYEIAKRIGMRYVYLGNVPGHKYENTYCPECGTLLVKRFVFTIIDYNVTEDGRCPKCGAKINIVINPNVNLSSRSRKEEMMGGVA